MNEINIPNNWQPRPYQRNLWNYLEAGGSRAVAVWHRRAGKDDVALHYTATQVIEKPGNYWHMLPQYNQARKVVWDAINPKTSMRRIDEAFPEEIRKKTRRQEMSIEFKTGAIWQLVGSDNYNAYVGSPPRGIVLSEWAVSNPMVWAFIAPILEENNGWAIFIYTARGANHGKTIYESAIKDPEWFSEKLTAKDTPIFAEAKLEKIKDEYITIYGPELGLALFDQEYFCSFEGAVFGAYFAGQMRNARQEGRIGDVPHTAGIEVDTAWDLGVDDSMSIWFMQPVGDSYNFIDYYEGTGYGLEHYAKVLKDKGYQYGNHWMPHDVEVREMSSAEIAKTRKEVAEGLGIKPIMVVPRARNMDTIIQVHIPTCRNVLEKCRFDEKKCIQGIAGLENYRSEYDEEKKVLGNRPIHEWSIHPADAFRTFAVGYGAGIQRFKPVDLERCAA